MLYGLGNAVHRPEGKDQPWGGAVHCLVVRAVDGEAGAVEGVEQAARLGADRVTWSAWGWVWEGRRTSPRS